MAMDFIGLSVGMGYTDETVIGGGALKGKNCVVSNIEEVTDGINVTFQWTLDNGTVQTETVLLPKGTQGEAGVAGKSAYEIWLEAGNTGTEEDFLISLVGEKGADGTMTFEDLTEEQKASLKGEQGEQGEQGEAGADGKSAYQYAKDGGYIGTETEFTTNIARSGVISKELEVERARIDNLTTLQDGSTTGDAELIDARVGFDGTIYSSAGESVRTQNNDIKNLINYGKYEKRLNFEQGAILNDGTENNITTHIKSNIITFGNGILDIILNEGYKVAVSVYENNDASSFIKRLETITTSCKLYVEDNKYYKIVIGYDDITPLTPDINVCKCWFTSLSINNANKKLDKIVIGDKLFDKLTPNKVINTGNGEEQADNGSYATTPFIDLENINNLYVSKYRNYCMYNESKEYIFGTAIPTTEITNINPIRSDAKYIRFTAYIEDLETFIVSQSEFTEGSILEYGDYIKQANNKLRGKTVYSFGDSLMYGHHNQIGMLDYLVENEGMIYSKYSLNGHHIIGSATTTSSILYDITNASSSVPDFVVFNGLTNDAYDTTISNNLGLITEDYNGDYDTSTFYGSFEQICFTLRNKYPSSNIIYVAPHKMPTRSKNAQNILQLAVKEICKKWSIPVVDIYNEGQINTYIDKMRNDYSYNEIGETTGGNGTHLNENGYKLFYAPLIKSQLKKMI